MNNTSNEKAPSKPTRNAHGLLGDGIRGSKFHLGVMHRLEELGIVKHGHTISAVSGGSRFAGYSVIEIGKRLHKRRERLRERPGRLDEKSAARGISTTWLWLAILLPLTVLGCKSSDWVKATEWSAVAIVVQLIIAGPRGLDRDPSQAEHRKARGTGRKA